MIILIGTPGGSWEDSDALVACCIQHVSGMMCEQGPAAEQNAHETKDCGLEPFPLGRE
jgi:hypothetical protein